VLIAARVADNLEAIGLSSVASPHWKAVCELSKRD